MTEDSSRPKGIRERLWRRPRSRLLLGIPVGGFLFFFAGVIGWTGFNTAMDWSNSEEFCVSCHVMKANVYPEYTESVHYSNSAGIRAVCSDCHVPKNWFLKVGRKTQATLHEVPHWLMGTINTREKFEERRMYLANRVWKTMQANDSRECRNCHEADHMDFEKQDRFASRRHQRGFKKGETCIDCHRGVAHHLPKEEYEEDDEDEEDGETVVGRLQ